MHRVSERRTDKKRKKRKYIITQKLLIMRKGIGIFILGVITGVVIVLLGVYFNDDTQAPGNLKAQPVWDKQPSECISSNNFRVFQALSAGYALAVELEKGTYSNVESASGMTVLLFNPDGKQYETGEIVKVSKSKCVRKVGVYTYSLSNGDKKTVPVVQIMPKDEEK